MAPVMPATACRHPACPERPPGRYCDKHQRAHNRQYDAARPSPAKRGYDARWRKLRRAYLSKNPACAHCGRMAAEVHHITPLAEGGTHWERNLMALCKPCHSSEEARSGRRFRK